MVSYGKIRKSRARKACGMAVWMGRRHAYIRPQPTAHRSLHATRFPQIDRCDRWDASIQPPAQVAKKHLQTMPFAHKKAAGSPAASLYFIQSTIVVQP